MSNQSETGRPTGTTTRRRSGIDGFFKITERGSTVGREVRGGVVTFFTMAYIIVLNPLILGFAPGHRTATFLGGGDGPTSRPSPPAPRWSPA